MQKVYLADGSLATFVCPECGIAKTMDVTPYLDRKSPLTVKVTCTCGVVYTALVEKRTRFRKQTQLKGTYTLFKPDAEAARGGMTVTDISKTGFGLRLDPPMTCAPGDYMDIAFTLDNKHRRRIEKTVVVQRVNGPDIGVEFAPTEREERDINFYLFNA